MTGHPRTVMLIDDSEVDRLLCRRLIGRSGLFERVLAFAAADEALSCLSAQSAPRPDAILLDVNLPRMTGIEFLEAAACLRGGLGAPVVVMLTVPLPPREHQRALRTGLVTSYHPKPLTLQVLQDLAARAPVA